MHINAIKCISQSSVQPINITKSFDTIDCIGDSIISVFNDCFVIFGLLNDKKNRISVKGIFGIPHFQKKLSQESEWTILNRSLKISKSLIDFTYKNIYGRTQNLSKITNLYFNKDKNKLIDKLNTIKAIYFIPFGCKNAAGFYHLFSPRKITNQEQRFLGSLAKISSQVLQKNTEVEALRIRANFLNKIYKNIDSFLLTIDVLPNGKFVYDSINPAYEKATGLTQKFLKGKSPADLIRIVGKDDVRHLEEMYTKCRDSKQILSFEEKLTFRGKTIYILTRLIPIIDSINKKVVQIIRTSTNITDRKITEKKLRLFFTATEQNSVAVVITDKSGKIEYANPAFTQTSGYHKDEVIGKNPRILKSGFQKRDFYKRMWDTILSGKIWKGEFHNKNKQGEFYWEYSQITPLLDKNGEITHFVAIKEDITERKEFEEYMKIFQNKLERLASIDEMTEIFNRRTGLLLLKREMAMVRRTKMPLSVVFIDLNNLKKTNDTYGHSEGDFLIQSMSKAIKAHTRDSDSASRMGGDEFMILYPRCSRQKALLIMKRIQNTLDHIRSEFQKKYQMNFGFGIIEYNENSKMDMETLLEKADQAMYEHKKEMKESIKNSMRPNMLKASLL